MVKGKGDIKNADAPLWLRKSRAKYQKRPRRVKLWQISSEGKIWGYFPNYTKGMFAQIKLVRGKVKGEPVLSKVTDPMGVMKSMMKNAEPKPGSIELTTEAVMMTPEQLEKTTPI